MSSFGKQDWQQQRDRPAPETLAIPPAIIAVAPSRGFHYRKVSAPARITELQ